MPHMCNFQTTWLSHKDYKIWIMKDKATTQAKCKLCDKTFDISNMGEAVMRSHIRGKGHIDFVVKLQSQPLLPALMPGLEAESSIADESVRPDLQPMSKADIVVATNGASGRLPVSENDT